MYQSFLYVCLLLSFFLAISGCNDSNDDVHAESSVTMGLIFPLSETTGKPRHHAALLAAQHLAEAGYPIQTVVADSKLDRFLGVEAARRLVENGGAKILIGASDSDVTIEIAEWVSIPNQIPQISYASTSPTITELKDDNFIFRTAPSDKLQGAVLAYLVKELKGYDEVAVIYRQGSYGENLYLEFQSEFEKRGGQIIGESAHQDYPSGDSSVKSNFFTNMLGEIIKNKPQAIVAISREEESNIYIKQAFDQNKFENVKFFFVDANKAISIFEDNNLNKNALNKMCGTSPPLPEYTKLPDDPRLIFEDKYEAKFGSIDSTYLHRSYDAVIVAGLAAYSATKKKKGQTITSVDIRDQLDKVANPPGTKIGTGADNIKKALEILDKGESINYEGASGNVDFNEKGDVITPIEIWCYNNGQIQTDKICEVTDGELYKQVVCKEPTLKPSQ
jgi:branched-chain amino acid transport system substrate-binding protein